MKHLVKQILVLLSPLKKGTCLDIKQNNFLLDWSQLIVKTAPGKRIGGIFSSVMDHFVGKIQQQIRSNASMNEWFYSLCTNVKETALWNPLKIVLTSNKRLVFIEMCGKVSISCDTLAFKS